MCTNGWIGAIHFGDDCISPRRKDEKAGYHFFKLCVYNVNALVVAKIVLSFMRVLPLFIQSLHVRVLVIVSRCFVRLLSISHLTDVVLYYSYCPFNVLIALELS